MAADAPVRPGLSARVRRVAVPPVDRINAVRRALEAGGASIINLGQAVPDFGPPLDAGEIARIVGDPRVHGYTPDAGLQELREAVARRLGSGGGVDAERVLITAGANHAFAILCATLCDEGDRVGLLSPYFLNHRMAVEGSGAEPVELGPAPDFGYDPDQLGVLAEGARLKALVVVNPSNPTGKVFSASELAEIADVCERAGCWLLVDEVYAAFTYSVRHVSSVALPGADDRVIAFGSFSKEFGLTGWRAGWVYAPTRVIAELLKAQDYSLICAPHASQRVALAALRAAPEGPAPHLAEYARRRNGVLRAVEAAGCFDVYSGEGGFFLWFRPHRPIDAEREVLRIMELAGVCLVPGGAFGTAWSGWLRLSYGCAPLPLLEEAVERLAAYFRA